jgi:VanZ family protein
MFIGTHVPRIPVSMEGGGTDKWLHFGAYAGLGLLLSATLNLWRPCERAGCHGVTVILVGALYGVADEWLQGFVGRDPDVLDWRADVLGIVFGTAVFHWVLMRWLPLRRKR